MRTVARVILGFAIIGSLIAIGLSVWPGLLNDLVFIAIIFSVIWFPLAVIAFIVVTMILLKRLRQGRLSRAPLVELWPSRASPS